MKDFEEKTLSTKELYNGKIIDLVLEDVELPNGKQGKREIIKHPGAVAVIARTDENKIILVKQYRKALERAIVEIPAGKLEVRRRAGTYSTARIRRRNRVHHSAAPKADGLLYITLFRR